MLSARLEGVNYLGHLLVLPDAGLITLGNLLGDFFKGRVDSIEPEALRIGVSLHREIDRFTDAHPVVRRSIERIAPERRRVAGVLVDVFYDHFLAQGVDVDALRIGLLGHVDGLPAPLQSLPARMVTSGWLGSYGSIGGIGQVLTRMEARRKRVVGLDGAEIELERHYEGLAADVREFYPEVVDFTQETLRRLG
jgi:acyl carrier protein phosphodiesterase